MEVSGLLGGILPDGEIRMSRGDFLRKTVYYYGRPYILAASLIFIALMALGIFVDLRFCVLALMVLFIMVPMAAAMLYYVYGLREGCYMNVTAHTLRLTPEGIELCMRFPRREDGQCEDGQCEDEQCKDEQCNDEQGENVEDIRRIIILPLSELGGYVVWKDAVTFRLRRREGGFLWIPIN